MLSSFCKWPPATIAVRFKDRQVFHLSVIIPESKLVGQMSFLDFLKTQKGVSTQLITLVERIKEDRYNRAEFSLSEFFDLLSDNKQLKDTMNLFYETAYFTRGKAVIEETLLTSRSDFDSFLRQRNRPVSKKDAEELNSRLAILSPIYNQDQEFSLQWENVDRIHGGRLVTLDSELGNYYENGRGLFLKGFGKMILPELVDKLRKLGDLYNETVHKGLTLVEFLELFPGSKSGLVQDIKNDFGFSTYGPSLTYSLFESNSPIPFLNRVTDFILGAQKTNKPEERLISFSKDYSKFMNIIDKYITGTLNSDVIDFSQVFTIGGKNYGIDLDKYLKIDSLIYTLGTNRKNKRYLLGGVLIYALFNQKQDFLQDFLTKEEITYLSQEISLTEFMVDIYFKLN